MFADLLRGLTREQRHGLLVRWSRKIEIPSGPGACWTWIASVDSHGYGHINVRGHLLQAHRVAWALFRGDLSDDLSVLHTCNRGHEGCVTPSHLRLGTHEENMRDMINAGRQGAAKITADQARAIRSDTRPYRQIAEQYGISRSSVCLIKQGKNWAHLSDEQPSEVHP